MSGVGLEGENLDPREVDQEMEIEVAAFLRPDIKARGRLRRGLHPVLGVLGGTTGGMFSTLNPAWIWTVDIGYYTSEMEVPREAASHQVVEDKVFPTPLK